MTDPIAALQEGLHRGLADADDLIKGRIDRLSSDELVQTGRFAIQLALAPLLWDERRGPTLETAQVCERLGVTRQAVAKRVDAGRLLALPGGRTRRFPVWQFRFGPHTEVRDEVAVLLSTFRDVYPQVRPDHVASWAMTPQPELDDVTPAQWLEHDRPLDPVLLAARRAGAALAQ